MKAFPWRRNGAKFGPCVVKVGRLGQAAKLSAECPGLFLPVFPAAGTGTQEGRSYPAPWVEGCWGPRGLSLQPLREFTQGMGEKNQGWQRPQEHPLHGLPWPLLQTSGACQLPMNVRGPKLGLWGGSGSDQTERLCQGSGARGGQSILVVLEAHSLGEERPKVASLYRGSPHVPGAPPVASAFSGWLAHSRIQPCRRLWQARPLPLGAGLLQPSQAPQGGGQAGSLPIAQIFLKKSRAPRSLRPPKVPQP